MKNYNYKNRKFKIIKVFNELKVFFFFSFLGYHSKVRKWFMIFRFKLN